MIDPVYILIRTSNRPIFFGRMMETIKNQTYKNIVTIVHSDDPRDEYVTGDIVIKGVALGHEFGNGTYNIYNNRLLKAIPKDKPGWYHFIDDDDEYAAPDVIEKLVANAKKDHVNVARVERWDGVIFPSKWGEQNTFQTEIFFIHTDHSHKAKWWGNKGGDHYYSKQLTRIMPINWIDNLITVKAQEGKGHGYRFDKGSKQPDYINSYPIDKKISVIGLQKYRKHLTRQEWINPGEIKFIKYGIAYELEKQGIVKVTHYAERIEKPMPRQIY
jgi:hypothetical protein